MHFIDKSELDYRHRAGLTSSLQSLMLENSYGQRDIYSVHRKS